MLAVSDVMVSRRTAHLGAVMGCVDDVGIAWQRRGAQHLQVVLDHVIGGIHVVLARCSPSRHQMHALEGRRACSLDLHSKEGGLLPVQTLSWTTETSSWKGSRV